MNWFSIKSKLDSESAKAAKLIRAVRKLPIEKIKPDDIKRVCFLMKTWENNIKIQQSACQTFANICMNDLIRDMLINQNAHVIIMQCLERYYSEDWRICLLACSAIWNLTLSGNARTCFPRSIIGLLVRTLLHHQDSRVSKTVIGCLSNLSLDQSFRELIGSTNHVKPILKLIRKKYKDGDISSTAAGLFANLAVDDDIAERLVTLGTLNLIKKIFEYTPSQIQDVIFQRNVIAALRNCRNASQFINQCIKYRLIENIYNMYENAIEPQSMEMLILAICDTLQIEFHNRPSSFHLASSIGNLSLLQYLIQNPNHDHHNIQTLYHDNMNVQMLKKENSCFLDINMCDMSGQTLFHYAYAAHQLEMISFLIKCGATVPDTTELSYPAYMLDIFCNSKTKRKIIFKEQADVLTKITPLPYVLCDMLLQYTEIYNFV